MRLYFDRSVFDHVLAAGEEERSDGWLREEGRALLLSGEHLAEALRIPDAGKRRAFISLLTSAPRDHLPPAYLHAEELRAEIRRLRPRWMRRFPDSSRVSYWLNASKRRWVEAKLPCLGPELDLHHSRAAVRSRTAV
jgi:hypothetical protein